MEHALEALRGVPRILSEKIDLVLVVAGRGILRSRPGHFSESHNWHTRQWYLPHCILALTSMPPRISQEARGVCGVD